MESPIDPKLMVAFTKYAEWLSLPRHFCKFTQEELEVKGFTDELSELIKIQYKKDFSAKFSVDKETLQAWDKTPELKDKIKANWKKWCKNLTPGVMGKFYEKLMEEADPARMKIWLQTVEEEGKDESNVNVNIGIENIRKSMLEDGEIK